ncbi:MAG TPA: hypothetical protein VMV79_00070 [Alphaproteobacteria bacterium]|nr:hypothetical protein [Alphaproteobacteria bacterium]
MLSLSAWQGLPFADQFLHGVHFMLCAFATVVACVPLLTPKGSPEHKFGGLLYVPVAMAALLLAGIIAWREASLVLFSFDGFCAYLLLSGWRAVHEKENPAPIDWLIPGALIALAIAVALHALFIDQGPRAFYLLFFTLNAFYLAHRDWKHLRRRANLQKLKLFLIDENFAALPMEWLNRHVAGMAGSAVANLSVVVLTLLPLSLHWLWPVTLIALAGAFALRERQKKERLRKAFPAALQPSFAARRSPRRDEDDFRRAA